MDTRVATPRKLFSLPQYLRVPLFQRPYVWREDHQWEPLWEDVRRLTELRMATAPDATHFLGAVVMQQVGAQMGDAEEFALIDGQQRLTTVQLLMDAAAAVFEALGLGLPTRKLAVMTHNPEDLGFTGRAQLKIQHSNDDAEPFTAVMLAEAPVVYDDLDAEHLIVGAHRFFAGQVQDWLGDPSDHDALAARADALAGTLMTGLEFVVISLSSGENSQAIFETLNARGTPLTQADLVKNFVFQCLEREHVDTAKAYETHWKMFDQKFWVHEVRVGRYLVPRVALFLNHWLVAQTSEEVSTQATFVRFRQWFEYSANRPMGIVIEQVHRAAEQYEQWIRAAANREAPLDRPSLFVYRTQAAGLETVKPALLWLYDSERALPETTADAAIAMIESWAMRRSLLRRPTSDISRLIAALLAELREAEPDRVVERTQQFLVAQNRPGTYWPTDSELRAELPPVPAYRQHPRGRLRIFLEAFEDDARGYTSLSSRTGSRVPRDSMHIEHVLPQRWRTTWPVPDLQAEVDRDNHVHRFGNLTLLTGSLNSSLSNGPWGGENGKRSALIKHDVLLVNRGMRGMDDWDEGTIDRRTSEVIDALIRTWPTPAGHDIVPVAATGGAEEPWIEFREIVAAGHVPPESTLRGRQGTNATATVTSDGLIQLGDRVFDSPSGAGKAVIGRNVNGWKFWQVEDGRRLDEVREEFRAQRRSAPRPGDADV